jgi:hypothetical protein
MLDPKKEKKPELPRKYGCILPKGKVEARRAAEIAKICKLETDHEKTSDRG